MPLLHSSERNIPQSSHEIYTRTRHSTDTAHASRINPDPASWVTTRN